MSRRKKKRMSNDHSTRRKVAQKRKRDGNGPEGRTKVQPKNNIPREKRAEKTKNKPPNTNKKPPVREKLPEAREGRKTATRQKPHP